MSPINLAFQNQRNFRVLLFLLDCHSKVKVKIKEEERLLPPQVQIKFK